MNLLRFSSFLATVAADMLSFNRALNSVAIHVKKSTTMKGGMHSYAFGKYQVWPIISDTVKAKLERKRIRNRQYRNYLIRN
jgi:hypothetical protein